MKSRGWALECAPRLVLRQPAPRWAVELPFDRNGNGNHGFKAVGRKFSDAGIGWYRRAFTGAQTSALRSPSYKASAARKWAGLPACHK